jgi:hypothetical protein
MGSLTPGATYIYERVGDKIYARESGKNQRIIIGYDGTSGTDMWPEILRAAESNLALQKAIDRVILIYQTVKEENE